MSSGLCLRVLLFERDKLAFKPSRRINRPMLLAAGLMAIFSTLDGKKVKDAIGIALFSPPMLVAFGLRHNLDAFIFYNGPGGATREFEDISYWVNNMKAVDLAAQIAIGDAILVCGTRTYSIACQLTRVQICCASYQIYRMYAIFEKSWKLAIFPIVLWLATLSESLSTACLVCSLIFSFQWQALQSRYCILA